MNESKVLPTKPFEHPAMDYDFLRQEGIRHLERLSGRLWTDFNAHDPGITILEQVCFALSDLAYRINYDIPDLLEGDGIKANDSFFSPAEILTTRPITSHDLRKLVIDINGIKNAWVEVDIPPIDSPDFYYNDKDGVLTFDGDRLRDDPVFLKGLYRVAVEFEDTLHLASMSQERDRAWREVIDRLQNNRGLGEDFSFIDRLEAQYVQILAYVEIASVDSPEQVLLDIFEQLSEHISPSITFNTLNQLLEQGKRIDEIYDGPRLTNGFIDDATLQKAERLTVLRTSDLIQAMMDAPGVKAVRYLKTGVNTDFSITTLSEGERSQFQEWSLDLDPRKAPKLDVKKSAIILQRNGLPVTVNKDAVNILYETRLQQVLIGNPLAETEQDIPPPRGTNRQVGDYYSIQHQFPATYGIGELGLPLSASLQRQAQAKQLKAYLLFFDQLIANYFSQLAHVKDLFSFFDNSTQTYFSQIIDDPALGLDDIRREGHEARLLEITNLNDQSSLQSAERRNRFLNHLLARFAEQFTDYALLLYGSTANQSKLIQDKQAYLQNYPYLSCSRGTAYNYLMPAADDNSSGLEQRIRYKLGIQKDSEDFLLIENILLRPMAGDIGQTVAILTDSAYKDPFSLRLTFAFPASGGRYSDASFRQFVQNTVRDETPAHLTVDIQWHDENKMTVLKTAYQDWLDKRRAYWTDVDFSREVGNGQR